MFKTTAGQASHFSLVTLSSEGLHRLAAQPCLLQPLTSGLPLRISTRLEYLWFLLEKLKPRRDPTTIPPACYEGQRQMLGVIIESWLRRSPDNSQLSISLTNGREWRIPRETTAGRVTTNCEVVSGSDSLCNRTE